MRHIDTTIKSQIREKNQITIPPQVMKYFNLSIGDLLVFEQHGKNIIVRKAVIEIVGDTTKEGGGAVG